MKTIAPDQVLSPKKLPDVGNGWEQAFLTTLRETGNVRLAAEYAGISRQRAYARRQKAKSFRDEWDRAMADAVDKLEAIAWMRAMHQSDTLLIFLLKANRPDLYRDTTRHELANADGQPFKFTLTLDDPNS